MKLHIDQTVSVVVSSVQVYGLWCRHAGETEILVNIPETSWIASFNSCEQIAEIGDSLDVRILNIDLDSGKIAASIRAQYADPWESREFSLNQRYAAKVVRFVECADRCGGESAYLVELIPGSYAMLCSTDPNLLVGQTVNVIIESVDPERHHVSISLENGG